MNNRTQHEAGQHRDANRLLQEAMPGEPVSQRLVDDLLLGIGFGVLEPLLKIGPAKGLGQAVL